MREDGSPRAQKRKKGEHVSCSPLAVLYLSGVRSNHLSYRPCRAHSQSRRGPFRGRNSSSSSSSNSSSRSSYSSRSSRSSSSSSTSSSSSSKSSSRSLSSSKSPNCSSPRPSPRRLSDQSDVSRDNIVTPS